MVGGVDDQDWAKGRVSPRDQILNRIQEYLGAGVDAVQLWRQLGQESTHLCGSQSQEIADLLHRPGNLSVFLFHLCYSRRSKADSVRFLQVYVHYWDMHTCIPEVMQSLNHLVSSRKVLYLGISDTPAWVVAKCNSYARQYGLRQFSVYQGKWSAAERDFERDIIPMCTDEGMSLAPWGALGGGYFKPKGQSGKDGGRNFPHVKSKDADQVSEVLEKIAKRKGTLITSVALAYVMHKAPYVFPICGGRKVEHLRGNIEALGLQLSEKDMEEIEQAYPFDVGFPHNMLAGGPNAAKGPQDNAVSKRLGHIDYVQAPQPIPPQRL